MAARTVEPIRTLGKYLAGAVAAAMGLQLLMDTARNLLPLRAPRIGAEVFASQSESQPSLCSGQAAVGIRIRNRGTAILRLYEVRSACHALVLCVGPCTPCVFPLEIPPGHEVVLQVRFKKTQAHDDAEGETVTLYSNDPEQPAVTIHL